MCAFYRNKKKRRHWWLHLFDEGNVNIIRSIWCGFACGCMPVSSAILIALSTIHMWLTVALLFFQWARQRRITYSISDHSRRFGAESLGLQSNSVLNIISKPSIWRVNCLYTSLDDDRWAVNRTLNKIVTTNQKYPTIFAHPVYKVSNLFGNSNEKQRWRRQKNIWRIVSH